MSTEAIVSMAFGLVQVVCAVVWFAFLKRTSTHVLELEMRVFQLEISLQSKTIVEAALPDMKRALAAAKGGA